MRIAVWEQPGQNCPHTSWLWWCNPNDTGGKVRRFAVQGSLKKQWEPYLKNNSSKKGLGFGLSGRALASQAQGPEFKLHCYQKKKKKRHGTWEGSVFLKEGGLTDLLHVLTVGPNQEKTGSGTTLGDWASYSILGYLLSSCLTLKLIGGSPPQCPFPSTEGSRFGFTV
jgi:hypothetical protein